MSLRPDDRSGRSRSKSPGGRDRERSRSRSDYRASESKSTTSYESRTPKYEVRSPKATSSEKSDYFSETSTTPGAYPPPPSAPSYPQPPSAPSYPKAPSAPSYPQAPSAPSYPLPPAAPSYPPPPGAPRYSPPQDSDYHAPPTRAGTFPLAPRGPSYPPAPAMPYPREDNWTMGDYKDYPPQERPGYIPPAVRSPLPRSYTDGGLGYGDPHSPPGSRQDSHGPTAPQRPRSPQPPQAPRAPNAPGYPSYQYRDVEPAEPNSRSSSYTYQYAQPPDKISYTANPQTDSRSYQYTQTQSSHGQFPGPPLRTQSEQATYTMHSSTVERSPYDERSNRTSASYNNQLSVDGRSGGGLTPRMDHLSIGGSRPDQSSALPPPSPLLEAYRGTYQQMSPMPMAMRLDDDKDLEDLEPLSPITSRSQGKGVKFTEESKDAGKEKKRVKVYDEVEDATLISKALSKTKPDHEAICDILPGLSHDQLVYLKKEYKKQVKVQSKGVNLSKHLKTKITGNFGKAVYVTSLGKWESEGYWANFFYQSHNSRRELLIESLIGRTNGEIWNIKDEFKDKRYSDDLVKCMEKELKMDKFRTAILMVLEEKRQEEQDTYGMDLINMDVERLRKALVAKQGGESTMLEVVILRSDSHLREIMKVYEATYRDNFPRAALKKSNNLVGEVIAHVLNGVINKPARDALLLRHAIEDIADKNKEEELRYELLISRLVRLHWDRVHLIRVKKEYEIKYRKTLEEDIEDCTKGDFADFMIELCQTKQR